MLCFVLILECKLAKLDDDELNKGGREVLYGVSNSSRVLSRLKIEYNLLMSPYQSFFKTAQNHQKPKEVSNKIVITTDKNRNLIILHVLNWPNNLKQQVWQRDSLYNSSGSISFPTFIILSGLFSKLPVNYLMQ